MAAAIITFLFHFWIITKNLILENLYVIFPVRPYHQNIARSILKESKYYLYDTGAVEGDLGAKLENVVSCALLRELHFIEVPPGVVLPFII